MGSCMWGMMLARSEPSGRARSEPSPACASLHGTHVHGAHDDECSQLSLVIQRARRRALVYIVKQFNIQTNNQIHSNLHIRGLHIAAWSTEF